jgi:hypothetical protein
MFPNWIRWFGTRHRVSRPMTLAEEKAFDKVFDSMDQTFKAMDELFDVARSAGATPPPRSGNCQRRGKRK